MGICFIPEFSPTVPGLVIRPLVDPEVARGLARQHRRPSLLTGVGTFVKAIKAYK